MKLFYFRHPNGVTNFGDELNRDVWRHFLPGAFDEDGATLFVGIGTLLNEWLPKARRTVIFGSGVGYGTPRPDGSWKVYCVRGPLSARALGLPADTALTDPAVLVSLLPTSGAGSSRWKYGFMPHWESETDQWARVCGDLGIGFIDPRWPPHRVLDAIRCTDVLVTEAMHGAIVADALRIPWVPVRTSDRIPSFKWEDWCGSMELEYRPQTLPIIWPLPPRAGLLCHARRWAKLTVAARSLKNTAVRARPMLSRADLVQERVSQLEGRLEEFRVKELGELLSSRHAIGTLD